MTESQENYELSFLHDKENYQIDGLDSEIYADQLCSTLLKRFHQYLLQDKKVDPLEAGSQAAGADYFLREFMIGKLRDNIFNGTAERVRQFAGNWYIISNLEPNIVELTAILNGTASFYCYCAENKLITASTVEQIQQICNKFDYFQQRIDDFHALSGNGYSAWDKACPLV